MLAEELGYRKEFGCGGALRFAAIAFFLALFKSLHVKVPGYVAKAPTLNNDTHVQWKVCERGVGIYVHCFLAKLSGPLTIH